MNILIKSIILYIVTNEQVLFNEAYYKTKFSKMVLICQNYWKKNWLLIWKYMCVHT